MTCDVEKAVEEYVLELNGSERAGTVSNGDLKTGEREMKTTAGVPDVKKQD